MKVLGAATLSQKRPFRPNARCHGRLKPGLGQSICFNSYLCGSIHYSQMTLVELMLPHNPGQQTNYLKVELQRRWKTLSHNIPAVRKSFQVGKHARRCEQRAVARQITQQRCVAPTRQVLVFCRVSH